MGWFVAFLPHLFSLPAAYCMYTRTTDARLVTDSWPRANAERTARHVLQSMVRSAHAGCDQRGPDRLLAGSTVEGARIILELSLSYACPGEITNHHREHLRLSVKACNISNAMSAFLGICWTPTPDTKTPKTLVVSIQTKLL